MFRNHLKFGCIDQYELCTKEINETKTFINQQNEFSSAPLLWSGGLQYIAVDYVCVSDICKLVIGCDESCDIS